MSTTAYCGDPVPAAASIPRPQITDHPVFSQMRSLPGIDDDGALRGAIVYLDLFEKKRWWGLDFRPFASSSSIFIFGSPTRNGDRHVIIPVSTETKLTIRTLRLYLSEGHKARNVFYSEALNTTSEEYLQSSSALTQSLPPNSTPCATPIPALSSSPKVTLAIVSRDATLVYYQIADGLLRPQRPLTAAQRLQRDALKRMGRGAGVGCGERKETEERLWGGKKPRVEEEEDMVSAEGANVEETADALQTDSEVVGQETGGRAGASSERPTGADGINLNDNQWTEGAGGGGDWEDDAGGFWD